MTSDRSAEAPQAPVFADHLMTALNNGALCLMISVGHRTGLFDAMRDAPELTSAELAARGGLNERYVREWLGAMVTGRVVQVDPNSMRFTLPAEHAALLTRAAAADNLGSFAQYIGLLGAVEDDIVDCFKKGGGVPYSRYPRFHDVGGGQRAVGHACARIAHPAARAGPGTPAPDRHTRARCRMRTGARAHAPRRALSEQPFRGHGPVDRGYRDGPAGGLWEGVDEHPFEAVDLTDFDTTAAPAAFDFVTTLDAVHDQAKPLGLLKGIHRTLAGDGVYLMQDIKGSSYVHKNMEHPLGTMLYTVSCAKDGG